MYPPSRLDQKYPESFTRQAGPFTMSVWTSANGKIFADLLAEIIKHSFFS
jgi:hypothetical protein